jgi:hypothetical protein
MVGLGHANPSRILGANGARTNESVRTTPLGRIFHISSSRRRLPKRFAARLGEKPSISGKGYNEKEGRDWSEIFV